MLFVAYNAVLILVMQQRGKEGMGHHMANHYSLHLPLHMFLGKVMKVPYHGSAIFHLSSLHSFLFIGTLGTCPCVATGLHHN
jgi:hypothetical protein